MRWGTSSFERLARKCTIKDRIKIDRIIKDFIA